MHHHYRPEEPARRPPHGRQPQAIGEAIENHAARAGWRGRLEASRVHERWPMIVGQGLVPHTEPVRLAGGVLVVRVVSSAWATEVRYHSAELARRANEVLGDEHVRRVQVVVGRSNRKNRR